MKKSKAQSIIENYGGGSLDLSGCDLAGITLPTSIGGYLDLRGSKNLDTAVYNCGSEKRTIAAYNHAENGIVVRLGCFIGGEQEAIDAINGKYKGVAAAEYCSKVSEAFKKYYDANGY